jgi:hypothetical protein
MRFRNTLLATVAAAGVIGAANVAGAASTSAQSTINFVQQVSVSTLQDQSAGKISWSGFTGNLPDSAAHDARIGCDGTLTLSGDGTATLQGGTPTAAVIEVNGEPGLGVSVSVQAASVSASSVDYKFPNDQSAYVWSDSATACAKARDNQREISANKTLPSDGTATLRIGGEWAWDATTDPTQTYSTTIDVTVQYQ